MGDRQAAALAVLAGALAAWPATDGAVRRRVRGLAPAGVVRSRSRSSFRGRPMSPAARRWLFAVTAGIAVVVLLGSRWGPLLGAAVAVAVERMLRRSAGTAEDDELTLALPLACDLLAVCLEAGIPPGAGVAAVAEASDHPLGDVLGRVAGLYRLGAEPARAWAEVPPPLDGLARAFVRAGGSGSSVVPALRGLASDVRASSRARTEAAVRRAGVWVLAPLGACFLPAFMCLGVAPLVLGIARDVFG